MKPIFLESGNQTLSIGGYLFWAWNYPLIENMLYKIIKISLVLPFAVSNAGEKIRFFSWVTMLSRTSCFKNRLNSVKSEMCNCSGNGLVYDYGFWLSNTFHKKL